MSRSLKTTAVDLSAGLTIGVFIGPLVTKAVTIATGLTFLAICIYSAMTKSK